MQTELSPCQMNSSSEIKYQGSSPAVLIQTEIQLYFWGSHSSVKPERLLNNELDVSNIYFPSTFFPWRKSSLRWCELWVIHARFVESFTESPETKKKSAQQESHWMKSGDPGSLFSVSTDFPVSWYQLFNPVLSQFTICITRVTVLPSLTRNSPLLRYHPHL